MQLDKATGSNLAVQMRQDIDAVKLKSHQQEILSAFFMGRREAAQDGRIPYETLRRVADLVSYEHDHAISLMQKLDDKLIELQNDKRQKEIERMKGKKPR